MGDVALSARYMTDNAASPNRESTLMTPYPSSVCGHHMAGSRFCQDGFLPRDRPDHRLAFSSPAVRAGSGQPGIPESGISASGRSSTRTIPHSPDCRAPPQRRPQPTRSNWSRHVVIGLSLPPRRTAVEPSEPPEATSRLNSRVHPSSLGSELLTPCPPYNATHNLR